MIETFAHEPDLAIRKKRARMRAWRRGMREMDLILGSFIDTHGESLTPERVASFEGLLACRDQDLYAWISGRNESALKNLTDNEASLLAEIANNWKTVDTNLS